MASVRFFTEKTRFNLPHPRKTANWIKDAVKTEKKELSSLNVIFCSDEYLSEINALYLKHTSLTDILTFDLSQPGAEIDAEIFISIPRVKENAVNFNVSFDTELHRVIIHGVLHLLGYNDKGPLQKAKMRKKEDAYLSLRT